MKKRNNKKRIMSPLEAYGFPPRNFNHSQIPKDLSAREEKGQVGRNRGMSGGLHLFPDNNPSSLTDHKDNLPSEKIINESYDLLCTCGKIHNVSDYVEDIKRRERIQSLKDVLKIVNEICQEYYEYDNNNPVILDLRDKLNLIISKGG